MGCLGSDPRNGSIPKQRFARALQCFFCALGHLIQVLPRDRIASLNMFQALASLPAEQIRLAEAWKTPTSDDRRKAGMPKSEGLGVPTWLPCVNPRRQARLVTHTCSGSTI